MVQDKDIYKLREYHITLTVMRRAAGTRFHLVAYLLGGSVSRL